MVSPSLSAARPTNVEVEPVTCWWRTGAVAVRVGETFAVVLTCSVLETEAARVIDGPRPRGRRAVPALRGDRRHAARRPRDPRPAVHAVPSTRCGSSARTCSVSTWPSRRCSSPTASRARVQQGRSGSGPRAAYKLPPLSLSHRVARAGHRHRTSAKRPYRRSTRSPRASSAGPMFRVPSRSCSGCRSRRSPLVLVGIARRREPRGAPGRVCPTARPRGRPAGAARGPASRHAAAGRRRLTRALAAADCRRVTCRTTRDTDARCDRRDRR